MDPCACSSREPSDLNVIPTKTMDMNDTQINGESISRYSSNRWMVKRGVLESQVSRGRKKERRKRRRRVWRVARVVKGVVVRKLW